MSGIYYTSGKTVPVFGPFKTMDVVPCNLRVGDNNVRNADFFLITCFKPYGWPQTKWDVSRFTTTMLANRPVWMQDNPDAPAPRNTPKPQEVCSGGGPDVTIFEGPATITFPAAPTPKHT